MLNILAKAKRKNVYNKHVQLPGMLTNIPMEKTYGSQLLLLHRTYDYRTAVSFS